MNIIISPGWERYQFGNSFFFKVFKVTSIPQMMQTKR